MQSVLELNMVESFGDLRTGNVAEVPHKMKQTLSKEQIGTSPNFSLLVLRYLRLRDLE